MSKFRGSITLSIFSLSTLSNYHYWQSPKTRYWRLVRPYQTGIPPARLLALIWAHNPNLLNSTHLLYLISADSHIHFMSYFCNIKGQTRQARWLLTNLTFYNQISGFFLLLQYVSNQDLIYLVFILNPFLKMNSISSFDFTTTS